jgi:anti-sigma regulatory factor (Ser/Thr protein kinase)
MGSNEFRMEFAARAASVPAARRAASAYLADDDISAAAILAIELCVSELATNAVLHAYPGGDGQFELAVLRNGSAVRVRVTDHGVGFDECDSAGLGLKVVGALSDGINVERLDGSTCVTANIPMDTRA